MKNKFALIIAAVLLCLFSFATAYAAEGDIALTDVSFSAGGNEITVIEAGEISVSATVQYGNFYNYNDSENRGTANVLLIAALYKNGDLSDVSCLSKAIYGGNNTFSFGTFSVSDTAKSKIRVMLWNKNLSSYSNTVTLSDKSFDTKLTSFKINGIDAEINNNKNYIWLETDNAGTISNVVSAEVQAGGTIYPDPAFVTAVNDGDTFTVTAADGSKEIYTVKLEKKELRYTIADMEGATLQANGIPDKTAADKADWDTNSVKAPATSELKTENNNTYWYYNTSETPGSILDLGKRTWSAVNADVSKATYSFNINMQSYLNTYSDISVYLGTGYVTELMISNNKDLPSDDAILKNNSLSKYQLRFRLGTSGRGYNIATLDVGQWYNVKVVARRENATNALIEYYVNGEMLYDSTYWFGHPDVLAKTGATDTVRSSFITNNYGSTGFFRFKLWSGARLGFGIDNIALYYTNPNQATPNSLHLLGDSISVVYDSSKCGVQQGFGYYLKGEFNSCMGFVNYSQGGNDTARFLNGGYENGGQWIAINYPWADIKQSVKTGDYVMIALGANDHYHALTESAFKENLKTFIDETRALGGEPILVTPHITAENSDQLTNRFGTYARYIKDVAAANNAVCLDLNTAMLTDLTGKISEGMSISDIREAYYAGNEGVSGLADNSVYDYVHLRTTGAQYVSNLIISLLKNSASPLKNYLVTD